MADEILTSTLTVSGKGEVDINLQGKPVSIVVEFKDDVSVPCDPHKDDLNWEVDFASGSFLLKIKWNVSGVRTILWAVDFTE